MAQVSLCLLRVRSKWKYDQSTVAERQLLNGIKSTYAYDSVNRVTDITHPFVNGSKTYHYDYDAVGNRLSAVYNGSATDSFGYEHNSQLTSFTPAGGSATSFGLDASGNRTSLGGVSYGVNNLNEYTTVGGKAATYNANGNTLTRYDASGTQWT